MRRSFEPLEELLRELLDLDVNMLVHLLLSSAILVNRGLIAGIEAMFIPSWVSAIDQMAGVVMAQV
jgi:hypothetical protein